MRVNDLSENTTYTSRYDSDILIHVSYNGWCLSKHDAVDSPLALISDQGARSLIMMEAKILTGFVKPRQEFRKGSIVHFSAYKDQCITAKVVNVIKPEKRDFMQNETHTYELNGVKTPLLTLTTGLSIKESIFFRCPHKYPHNE